VFDEPTLSVATIHPARLPTQRVCEQYANANCTLGYHQVYSSCFRSSLAAAVDKIHQEQVSALFAATSPPNTP